MTIYGWDASNWDAPPTARDGIDFYTHKAAEGHRFYRDIEYKPSLDNARGLGVPVLGAYFVNHPGTVSDQVDWFLSIVNTDTPWWRQYPWIWQIDAEKFSYMSRAPNLDEINGFADLICQRAQAPADSVIVYGPKWLYGDGLRGLRYRLWASDYGSNPYVPYRQAYPGDGSTRWSAYSGQTPVLLQYGSNTTIAGQTTCDANAYRGTLDQLTALLTGDDDMQQTEALAYPGNVKGRTVGQALVDVQNLRDWLIGVGAVFPQEPDSYPRPDSPLAVLVEAARRGPVQSAPVDPAVVAAAVKAALSDPDVLAAVAKAVADENARRQQA